MKPKFLLSILIAICWMALAWTARAQVPGIINYQGRIVDGGTNFNGTGQFEFALINNGGTSNYWSNDGTAVGQPALAVSRSVANGLYSVLLGDTTIPNMTVAVPAAVFTNADVLLRVWFNDGVAGFQQLAPDQRIAAAGYAEVAATVPDGSIVSSQLSSNLTIRGVFSAQSYALGDFSFLLGNDSGGCFVGESAGNVYMTGSDNTAVGQDAFQANTTGSQNTAIGAGAMQLNRIGSFNVAAGIGVLQYNSNGVANTASGFEALGSNTTGNANTVDGYEALNSATNASYDVAVGYQAGYNLAVGSNTAVGAFALESNTSGTQNTAIGFQALEDDMGGNNNTADGYQALAADSGGNQNTATGASALQNNTTGGENTANGAVALQSNTNGVNNTATGAAALQFNVSGSGNTANGASALQLNTSGGGNTADGFQALLGNTTGDNNTADGVNALLNDKTGSNNIAIGYQAGFNLTNGNNNIDIGNAGVTNEGSVIRIGTVGTQTNAYIAGISGVTISPAGAAVFVNSNGELGTVNSSQRFKQDIRDMGSESDVLLALRPVAFRYKHELDPQGLPQFGLIAEEVEKVDPGLVLRDGNGAVYTVRYEQINAMLLNEFQKEHRQVQELEQRLAEMEQRLERVSRQLNQSKAAPQPVANTGM